MKGKSFVQQWSESFERPTRCRLCQDKRAAEAIAEFDSIKKSGKTFATWRAFYREVLVKKLSFAGSYAAMHDHVRHYKERGAKK